MLRALQLLAFHSSRRRFPATIIRWGGISILLLSISPLSSLAQRFWPDPLDTIRVTAPRPIRRESAVSRIGTSTVIPLGPDVPASRDLGDLLDRTVGVHVHRYGGLGSFTLAGVRGSAPGQVVVCLDNTPVGSAGEGFVNLALLPVAGLERAEIYRGAQTRSFGGPPAAGVINLVSPRTLVVPLRLSFGAASFRTAIAKGQWGQGRGPFGAFLSGQFRRSRGDFSYLDRNGTLFGNRADDRWVKRRNNDFSDAALLWKGSWQKKSPGGGFGPSDTDRSGPSLAHGSRPALRFAYTGQLFRREGGVPGTENVQTTNVRSYNRRLRHDISALVDFGASKRSGSDEGGARSARSTRRARNARDARNGRIARIGGIAGIVPLTLEGGAYLELLRDTFENRAGEVGLTPAATQQDGRDAGVRFGGAALVPLLQETRLSLDLREERRWPIDLLRGQTESSRIRHHRALSFEDRITLGPLQVDGSYLWTRARDNFQGNAGGTFDGAEPEGTDRPGGGATLRHQGLILGACLEVSPGLLCKATRGQMARFPSFPELFGENGLQEGNPLLRPERGVQWDAGIAYAPVAPARWQWTYFESLLRDRILLLQNSQRTTKAQNLDRTWIRGLESSFYTALPVLRSSRLELQANVTWMQATDVGQSPVFRGKKLPNQPGIEGYLSSTLEHRSSSLRHEVSLQSSHYRDRYNTEAKRAPGSVVHDLTVEQRFAAGSWKVRLEIRNLGDVRLQDIDGFPLPGRTVLAEVTWTR